MKRRRERDCIILQLDFLTFEQSDSTLRLNVNRRLLRLECRAAARVSLVAPLMLEIHRGRCRGENDTWHSHPIVEYRTGEVLA